MSRKRRRHVPPAPGLIYRAGEVCTASSVKTAAGRKRVVDCRPIESVEVVEDVTPHCSNESCGCGVSYKDFRSGWTYADAFEMVGGRGGAAHRPSQRKVLRMMRKLKLDEWELHQRACAGDKAPRRTETDEGFWASLPADDFLAGRKRKPMACAKSTSIQTLIVSCEGLSEKRCRVKARRWAEKHRFGAAKIDCASGKTCRVRQKSPRAFCSGTFRTITLSERSGVKAVIGKARK